MNEEVYEEEEEEQEEETEKAPYSKCTYVEKKDNDEEVEEENERVDTFKKKVPRSKVVCKKATTRNVGDCHEKFSEDIFKSGRVIKTKNPYFVTKIRLHHKNQLYVPIDVVRNNKLELPSSMIIRDPTGREFETKFKSCWGGICLIGGWHSLCKWNLLLENEKYICEFVKGKYNKDLYL